MSNWERVSESDYADDGGLIDTRKCAFAPTIGPNKDDQKNNLKIVSHLTKTVFCHMATCLDKIACNLQRIFNINRKLKQVSKLNALKLGVCSKINACYIIRLHFLPDMPKLKLLTFAR